MVKLNKNIVLSLWCSPYYSFYVSCFQVLSKCFMTFECTKPDNCQMSCQKVRPLPAVSILSTKRILLLTICYSSTLQKIKPMLTSNPMIGTIVKAFLISFIPIVNIWQYILSPHPQNKHRDGALIPKQSYCSRRASWWVNTSKNVFDLYGGFVTFWHDVGLLQ